MAKRRGQETLGDMLRSLAVVGLGVLLFLALLPRHHHSAVHTIDYSTDLASARHAASYHVYAPVGLSKRWRATSVRVTHNSANVEFHLGFVSPHNQYAEIEESNADAAAFVQQQFGTGTTQLGNVTVAGTPWQQLRTARGELALIRANGQPTLIVTGSAKIDELTTLAAALQ